MIIKSFKNKIQERVERS